MRCVTALWVKAAQPPHAPRSRIGASDSFLVLTARWGNTTVWSPRPSQEVPNLRRRAGALWRHGPAMAAPTYYMYLLNFMARRGICPSAHDSRMGRWGRRPLADWLCVLEPLSGGSGQLGCRDAPLVRCSEWHFLKEHVSGLLGRKVTRKSWKGNHEVQGDMANCGGFNFPGGHGFRPADAAV